MDSLSEAEAREILAEAPVAHLGTIAEGKPYVTPMSYVVEADRILFRTMPGKKLESMRAHPDVCIEASVYDDETGDWASVIVTGRARVVGDDFTKTETIALLLRKYEKVMGSPLSRSGGIQPIGATVPQVVEVSIDEITGLASGRGWSRRTRPGRL